MHAGGSRLSVRRTRSTRCARLRPAAWSTRRATCAVLPARSRSWRCAAPMTPAAWSVVLRETIRRNRVVHGLVYLQDLTRRRSARLLLSADRRDADGGLPRPFGRPSQVGKQRRHGHRREDGARHPLGSLRHAKPSCCCCPLCWPNMQPRRRLPEEAWLVDADGCVTEGHPPMLGSSCDGRTAHHAPDRQRHILRGVTRDYAHRSHRGARSKAGGTTVFTVAEAKAAREAFGDLCNQLSSCRWSASTGQPIGNGARAC